MALTPEEACRRIVAMADNADSPSHSMQGRANAWASLGGKAVELAREAISDTEKLQTAVDKAYSALTSSAYVGGPSEREAFRIALDALGQVATQHTGQAQS